MSDSLWGKQRGYLMVGGNRVFGGLSEVEVFKGHPALPGWMGFDEPWGTLDKAQESYNIVKLLGPDRPISVCCQVRKDETADIPADTR